MNSREFRYLIAGCVGLFLLLACGSKSWATTVWATQVHNYEAGTNTVAGDEPAVNALGPWDTYHENHTWYGNAMGIGRDGTLELKMGLPFFDGQGDDIKVYEVGTSVGGANDPFEIWVSADAVQYYPIDDCGLYSSGGWTSFDLNTVGSSGPFLYVKIHDLDTSNQYDGADIDAVQALHPIPEPTTMLGVFLGLGSVAGYVKRRWRR